MSSQWQERIAGARMQVDQQFNDRVLNSQFTNQEWGLIMTAVEFDIENPENPDDAELVAKTENIKHVVPELSKIQQQQGMAGQGSQSGGSGILGSIRNLLTGTDASGSDAETIEAATALVDEYAVELQQFLEEQGRWEDICDSATPST